MLDILQSFTGLALERIEVFFLVLVRLAFALFLLPFFSVKEVPTAVKAGLSGLLALLVFPVVPQVPIAVQAGAPFFFILVLEQCMVGAIVGFGAGFVLYFIQIGGYLMARDIGVQNTTTTDPITEDSSDDLAVFLTLILSVVFLLAGNHLQLIRILLESFRYIPIGQFDWDTRSFATVFTLMFSQSFLTGIRLALPVLAAVFVASMALALAARVMPQMNVWIVGIPVKIGVGMLTLWFVFPAAASLMDSNFQAVQEWLLLLLRAGGKGG